MMMRQQYPSHGPGMEYLDALDCYWPAYDCQNERHITTALKDLSNWRVGAYYARKLHKRKGIAIQAGGNVGLWPRDMAAAFDKVYTFEPHPDLFQVLCQNIKGIENVQAHGCALGDHIGGEILRYLSLGSHYVDDTGSAYGEMGGAIKVITIDYFDLDDVTFICLDVEGFEGRVIGGAAKTIKKCRPVIQLEQLEKPVPRIPNFNTAIPWLKGIGYQCRTTVGNDHIYVPEELLDA